MDELVLAAAFLAVVGVVPARAAARSWGEAIPLAGAVTGLVCAAAAVAALGSGAPLLPWLVGMTTLAWGAGLLVWWRRRQRREPAPGEDAATEDGGRPAGLVETGLVALVTAPLLGTALVGPTAYDARMIWWFHAAWFWRGGDAAAAAMSNAFLNYNHPQYPPLTSASVGSLWAVVRGGDFWLAQAFSATQTWLALVLVAVLSAAAVRGRARVPAALVGALVVVAAQGLGEGFALRGYADVTWAAWATAGAIACLVLAPSAANARLAALCFAAAALTKAEGLTVVGGVLFPLVVARWALARRAATAGEAGDGWRGWLRTLRPLAWVAVAVAAGAAWLPIAYHYTPIPSEALSPESIGALLRGEEAQVDRIGPTLAELWRLTARPFLAVALVTVLGRALLGGRRRALGLGGGGWLFGAAAGAAAAVSLIYIAGRQPLDWWLSTSAVRTVTIIHLLLLAEALLWAAVALDAIARPNASAVASPGAARLARRRVRRDTSSSQGSPAPQEAGAAPSDDSDLPAVVSGREGAA